MKKLMLLLIPLLLFACSKNSPTEGPSTFILEVNNQTIIEFKIYVDGEFAGDSPANTDKEMGSFDRGSNTHLEARYDTLAVFDIYQDTRKVDKFIMLLQM
ncbi:MAG: hypothetical protein E3J78_04650 [Candidatus Cloacimonadota bacterium]|nr:MAG: hypothetical protein E3J78_04650 [Candidatus Cloacimonadota bacterium]